MIASGFRPGCRRLCAWHVLGCSVTGLPCPAPTAPLRVKVSRERQRVGGSMSRGARRGRGGWALADETLKSPRRLSLRQRLTHFSGHRRVLAPPVAFRHRQLPQLRVHVDPLAARISACCALVRKRRVTLGSRLLPSRRRERSEAWAVAWLWRKIALRSLTGAHDEPSPVVSAGNYVSASPVFSVIQRNIASLLNRQSPPIRKLGILPCLISL